MTPEINYHSSTPDNFTAKHITLDHKFPSPCPQCLIIISCNIKDIVKSLHSHERFRELNSTKSITHWKIKEIS